MIFFILSNLKDWKVFFSRSRSWVVKGGWAITDQAFFSGANFVVNILLARWLPPKEYGAFAVALSVFYLLADFHTAIITEPMMVFGAGKFRDQFHRYFSIVFWGHWVIGIVITIGLGVISLFFFYLGSKPMARALVGLAFSSSFLLFFWLTRRGCYTQLSPKWAVFGSSVNFLFVLGGLFLIWKNDVLSSLSGLLLLGIASLAGAFVSLTPIPIQKIHNFGLNLWNITIEHWKYGKWRLITGFLMWFPGNIYYLLLYYATGLEASAHLKALQTLLMPLFQTFNALSLILIPFFSNYIHSYKNYSKKIIETVILFLLIATGYWAFLNLWGTDILVNIYRGKYVDKTLLRVISLTSFSYAILRVLNAFLKAAERPDREMYSYGASILSAILVGIPLAFKFGVLGAIIGQVLSSYITMIIVVYFSIKIYCKNEIKNNAY